MAEARISRSVRLRGQGSVRTARRSGAASVRTTVGAAGLAAVAGVLAWGEWVHWAAERRAADLPPPPVSHLGARPTVAVLVLGFVNPGPRVNLVNRWRARMAVRTARRVERGGGSAVIVCSGGAVRGALSEARHLRTAVRSAGWLGTVDLEETSESTWQNIEHTRALLAEFDHIAICSNGLHAEKARAYLLRQDERLARRLVRADCYRFGEMTLFKPVFAVVGLRKLRALRA